jgi:tyrosine-protein phosphatase YwqE
MPSAKGVSMKPMVWDDRGNESQLDYTRMMKIVLSHGFNGYVGIEHGTEGREWESIEEIRVNLDQVRRTLANEKKV